MRHEFFRDEVMCLAFGAKIMFVKDERRFAPDYGFRFYVKRKNAQKWLNLE
jgi:hypothetical protein